MPDFGLQPSAARCFGFLVSEMGFKCTESHPLRVRFESRSAYVELVYDGNRSYELCLWIGRLGLKNPSFSIDEILRLCRAPEAEMFSLVQVTTSDAMANWIAKLAQVCRSYALNCLIGDEQAFNELEAQRRKESQQYALDRDLRVARVELEAAWHMKDYESVVKLLSPLHQLLIPSELAKLEFAEKQIRNSKC